MTQRIGREGLINRLAVESRCFRDRDSLLYAANRGTAATGHRKQDSEYEPRYRETDRQRRDLGGWQSDYSRYPIASCYAHRRLTRAPLTHSTDSNLSTQFVSRRKIVFDEDRSASVCRSTSLVMMRPRSAL